MLSLEELSTVSFPCGLCIWTTTSFDSTSIEEDDVEFGKSASVWEVLSIIVTIGFGTNREAKCGRSLALRAGGADELFSIKGEFSIMSEEEVRPLVPTEEADAYLGKTTFSGRDVLSMVWILSVEEAGFGFIR